MESGRSMAETMANTMVLVLWRYLKSLRRRRIFSTRYHLIKRVIPASRSEWVTPACFYCLVRGVTHIFYSNGCWQIYLALRSSARVCARFFTRVHSAPAWPVQYRIQASTTKATTYARSHARWRCNALFQTGVVQRFLVHYIQSLAIDYFYAMSQSMLEVK